MTYIIESHKNNLGLSQIEYKLNTQTGNPIDQARWISPANPTDPDQPLVAAYRLEISLSEKASVRLHLSADERYEFFVNGHFLGMGPERGDPAHWFFESYDVVLPPGSHRLVARVWSLGDKAPYAQMSLQHGFVLWCEDEALNPLLATGQADWQTKILRGYHWHPPDSCAHGTGWNQTVDGREFDWGHEKGEGELWCSTRPGSNRSLISAMLPPMMNEYRRVGTTLHSSTFATRPVGIHAIRKAAVLETEIAQWDHLLRGKGSVSIPPFTKRRILIDLEDYYCARPVLTLSGGAGASVEIHWAEALYENIDPPPPTCTTLEAHIWPKGHRDEIEGKYFACPWYRRDGPGDRFIADGGACRIFTTLWWQAGRYLQILVETDFHPLTIQDLHLRETRYPLETGGSFQCSDSRLEALVPLMRRGLQMCAHETFMDCPFYEQLMYVGDTRIELLCTYVISTDERLPRKALKLFDWSRLPSGLTQSRYPARAQQIIPPFALWWIAACHDYALWRGDEDFTRSLLPGVRAVCDHFAGLINEYGLVSAPDGWNFTDWTQEWNLGIPPEADTGISGILNWHAALAFRLASELETWFGTPETAALQEHRAKKLASCIHRHFWNQQRGLYADDLGHQNWSEHAQCMALLSDLVPESCVERLGQRLMATEALTPTSIYFSHYLFETYRKIGQIDALLKRLELWHALRANGLRTPIESPEPNRSDCHAWGAHPLYHYYASIAGIRPTAPGFTEVEIHPQLGSSLQWLQITLPHPRGTIKLRVDQGISSLELPDGVKLKALKVAADTN